MKPAGDRRSLAIAAALLGLCLLAFFFKYELRYGPAPYLFYGDANTGQPNSDAVTWNIHALHLVEGRGFGDYLKQFRSRNYVPPGHPLILGLFYYLFGKDPEAAGWCVAILFSLLPWVTYLWGREMWGRRVGLIMAALAALHAPYIHIGFSLMSEPTTVFTTAVSLWFGARMIRRPGLSSAALAGLAFGFSALVRPSALAFLWGLAVALLMARPPAGGEAVRTPGRPRLVALAALILCTLVPLGLWQYRNYRVHGRAAAVYSSISARHAWHGAHPKYGPGFYSREAWHETLWREPYAPELAMIQRLQAETDEFIRADRFKYWMSCIWRIKVLFPEFMHREAGIRWSHGGIGRIHFMALSAMAILGLLRALPLRVRLSGPDGSTDLPGALWAASLLIGLAAALAGAGIYGASDRYRWPLEFALIPFAALFLDELLRLSRAPFFTRGALTSSWPPLPAPLRFARRLGLAALALVVLAYAAGLARARRHPDSPEDAAPRLTEAQVLRGIDRVGLRTEFDGQSPRWITYDQVFTEQAANFGALTGLNMKLVAWWGRLRFVQTDSRGLARAGYVILDPRPGDFGGARLPIRRAPNARGPYRHVRDGDAVTLLARLYYEPGPIQTPLLVFYDILPGRFDGPAPGGAEP
ncbi:MAG TPA: glycosyltransferase family 39 protein [Kiritimatiellia bacterium]|nr:glycosyltransferase family 39 protein [Kiritimatiellia bacterium]HRZ11805.1 glycosyltransferase family 39 protein [Kiritimatiellia bacterium]HSA17389.1 glycosyltransferase family 39 protein [Kiritimatiellia bacterium]